MSLQYQRKFSLNIYVQWMYLQSKLFYNTHSCLSGADMYDLGVFITKGTQQFEGITVGKSIHQGE